jgi:hypothetical protein
MEMKHQADRRGWWYPEQFKEYQFMLHEVTDKM